MVHRRVAVGVAAAILVLSCGCACSRDWRPFGWLRNRSGSGCCSAELGDPCFDGAMFESAGGPMLVQPGEAMTTVPNGSCAAGQPSVVQPPRLIAQPQSAPGTPMTQNKNSR